jgi:hypothetical protein
VESYIGIARAYSEQQMPDVCEVVRTVRVSDGLGGYAYSEVIVATTSCRLSGLSASEEVTASRISTTYTGKASVPFGVQVLSSDRLKIGPPGATEANKVTYNVSGIMPRSPEHSPHQDVLVARSG